MCMKQVHHSRPPHFLFVIEWLCPTPEGGGGEERGRGDEKG